MLNDRRCTPGRGAPDQLGQRCSVGDLQWDVYDRVEVG
jgi:hypothetical protein